MPVIYFILEIFGVLSGILVQQNKYGRSLFLAIYYCLNGDEKVLNFTKTMALLVFAVSYISILIKLFFSKEASKISWTKLMKTYQVFLLIFTFGLITNFNPWYVIWLFPTIWWQKAKTIRNTMYVSLGVINSYAITYATKVDDETVGIPYLIVMLLTIAILEIGRQIYQKIKKEKRG